MTVFIKEVILSAIYVSSVCMTVSSVCMCGSV